MDACLVSRSLSLCTIGKGYFRDMRVNALNQLMKSLSALFSRNKLIRKNLNFRNKEPQNLKTGGVVHTRHVSEIRKKNSEHLCPWIGFKFSSEKAGYIVLSELVLTQLFRTIRGLALLFNLKLLSTGNQHNISM